METLYAKLPYTNIYFQGNIIIVRFLQNSNIDIIEAPLISEKVGELVKNTKCGILIDARDLMFITNDARKHFASQANPYVLYIALLINSVIQKSFANLYLKFAKPVIPTRMFNNYEASINWLKEQINIHEV